jgi:hypothetical protein
LLRALCPYQCLTKGFAEKQPTKELLKFVFCDLLLVIRVN